MRATAVALSAIGALLSLYVPVDAYRNNLNTGFPTPLVFFVIGAAFALVGVAGALLTLRGMGLAPWVLLLGTIGGLIIWPWLMPAFIYLAATTVSIAASRMSSRATRPRSGLA